MIPLLRSKAQVYEYACHEGNLGLDGILTGARAEERAEAGARNSDREPRSGRRCRSFWQKMEHL